MADISIKNTTKIKANHSSVFQSLGLAVIIATALDLEAQTVINVPADYSSIQEAFDAATDADTILVAPGIYQETIDMAGKSVILASWFLSTCDTSYISQTILDGDGGSRVIQIRGSVGPLTTIKGFTIRNADDGISPDAKFNILNCRIVSCVDGIDYEEGSGGLCKYNMFENNEDDGIDLDNEIDIIIENNIIRNNADDGIEIRLQPYRGPRLNYVIRNNQIYGNGEDGIQLIDYDTLTDRIFLIEGNLFYNNEMVGLGCMSGENTRENFEGASILERILLFNNTFSANAYGVTGGDSLVAVNNIFVDQTTLAMKNVDGGSIVSHSLYWSNSVDFENCNVDSQMILVSDPLLDSLFQLQPASPAIDAGSAYFSWHGAVVLDRSTNSYSGLAPDLGAFEFGSPVLTIGEPGFAGESLLQQNYPNPFNPTTRIAYSIQKASLVSLKIYDVLGREIQTLVSAFQKAGTHYIDLDGSKFSSGIYFYTLRIGDEFVETKKMVFTK